MLIKQLAEDSLPENPPDGTYTVETVYEPRFYEGKLAAVVVGEDA
jgi:hypothetical protein